MSEKSVEATKVYIGNSNEGKIFCPGCGENKIVTVPNDLKERVLKITCHCGQSFSILLDYRRHSRKNVNIPGKIFHLNSKQEINNVIITSLSLGGVGFKTQSSESINLDDVIEIEFTLDDKYSTPIREEIVVKRRNGNFVGTEFHDQNSYNCDLDFYFIFD